MPLVSDTILTLPIEGQSIGPFDFSPDGNHIAVIIHGDGKAMLHIWDSAAGAEPNSIRVMNGTKRSLPIPIDIPEISDVAFCSNGKKVIVCGPWESAGKVVVMDATTGAPISIFETQREKSLNPKGYYRMTLSPNGRCVAVRTADNIKVWDSERGIVLAHGEIWSPHSEVAFSSDGKLIALVANKKRESFFLPFEGEKIRIWDTNSGIQVRNIDVTSRIRSVAFSPDGSRIISGAEDGTVRVWDSMAGMELLSLEVGSPIYQVAFSPDGRHIFARRSDNTIATWDSAINRGTIFYQRGLLSNKTNQYDQAILDFCRAINMEPENSVYWYERGKAYASARHYDLAITDFNVTTQLDPNNSDYFLERATAYLEKKQSGLATADFNAAIQLGMSHNDLVNRAWLYRDAKRLDIAIGHYTAVLQFDPNHSYYVSQRGELYFEAGQYDLAIADFTRALQTGVTAWSLTFRGLAYLETKRYDLAINDFNRAIPIGENDFNLFWYLNSRGHFYLATKRYDLAIADFTKSIEWRSNIGNSWYLRGRAYFGAKQYRLALSDFNQAMHFDLKGSNNWYWRGKTYLKTKEYNMAIADFERVLQMDPNSPSSLNELGWLYATTSIETIRNGSKAVGFATQACKLTKWSNIQYLDTLAAAHAEAGDFESGIEWQEKAISLLTDRNRAANETDYKNRLDLYKSGKPYRDNP